MTHFSAVPSRNTAHDPMTRQIDLELEESRPFKNGSVYVSYRVVH